MKTKILFRLMAALLLVAVLPISFASCGDDDDDLDNGNDGSSIVPDGTITANIRNANNGKTSVELTGVYWCVDIGGFGTQYSDLFIDKADNLTPDLGATPSVEIVSVGKVKGLSTIKSVPTTGWGQKAAVIPGYGYIVRRVYNLREQEYLNLDTDRTYARIYVVDYMYDSFGGVIGATIQYQSPWGG